jgi:hypothetical protein
VAVTGRLLDQVRSGQLGRPPRDAARAGASQAASGDGPPASIRAGWL